MTNFWRAINPSGYESISEIFPSPRKVYCHSKYKLVGMAPNSQSSLMLDPKGFVLPNSQSSLQLDPQGSI